MFFFVVIFCKEDIIAMDNFSPILCIHLIFWPVILKSIYRHSDLTTHTLICLWLCIHAWRALNEELLCWCSGCNAWEMVDGAGELATHCHGERKGTHLEKAAVKMRLLGVCYGSPQPPVANRLLIKQKLDTETNYCVVLLCGLIQRLVLSVGSVLSVGPVMA